MWPPDIEQRYQQIRAETDRLQCEFGITKRSLDQRYQDYRQRIAEEHQQQEQLRKLEELRAQQPKPKPLPKTPL